MGAGSPEPNFDPMDPGVHGMVYLSSDIVCSRRGLRQIQRNPYRQPSPYGTWGDGTLHQTSSTHPHAIRCTHTISRSERPRARKFIRCYVNQYRNKSDLRFCPHAKKVREHLQLASCPLHSLPSPAEKRGYARRLERSAPKKKS